MGSHVPEGLRLHREHQASIHRPKARIAVTAEAVRACEGCATHCAEGPGRYRRQPLPAAKAPAAGLAL